jgi:hypothetical protein
MNMQTTTNQSIIFVIVIGISFFITMQVVYGQGQVNNSRVGKQRNSMIM